MYFDLVLGQSSAELLGDWSRFLCCSIGDPHHLVDQHLHLMLLMRILQNQKSIVHLLKKGVVGLVQQQWKEAGGIG